MRHLFVWMVLFSLSAPATAMMKDDPLLTSVKFELLEWREDDELVWDAEAWVGRDRDKLLLRTEGEWTSDATEEFETQLLYDRAITPFWNLQAGWRGDWQWRLMAQVTVTVRPAEETAPME